jgi:hypothetical protein
VTSTRAIEDGDPAGRAMLAEADLIALVRHADDDQPDARPGVEPAVDEGQLGRMSTDEHGSQRSAEATASLV